MTTRQATAKADRLCWVDENWDLVNASDRVSRYGAYLRGHTELFDPWQDAPGGITRDAGEFAIAALQVATGPIMSPGYLRWHPRVLDYKVSHGENPEPGRLVCQAEPDDASHAALARLELRWPIPDATLPRPHRPARAGYPNLRDAKASVRALVEGINQTAGPVLAKLDGGDQR